MQDERGSIGAVEAPPNGYPPPPRAGRRWSVPFVAYPAAMVSATWSLALLGLSARALLVAVLVAVLVVLSAIDLHHRLLPNVIVLPALAGTLLCQAAFAPDQMSEWLLGALGAATVLLIPALIKPGAIGMGDVKLAALLGAALGAQVFPALMLGFIAVGPVALVLVLALGSEALRSTLPLGPFLSIGAAIVFLA
jgi:leader peptidase (prepilin peptidase)/N-methyltransferase